MNSGVAPQKNQPKVKTIHSVILNGFKKLKTELYTPFHISSRTDSGVSALCNTGVVDLDLDVNKKYEFPLNRHKNEIECETLKNGLNDYFIQNNEHVR